MKYKNRRTQSIKHPHPELEDSNCWIGSICIGITGPAVRFMLIARAFAVYHRGERPKNERPAAVCACFYSIPSPQLNAGGLSDHLHFCIIQANEWNVLLHSTTTKLDRFVELFFKF
jgi:hypothetical protein